MPSLEQEFIVIEGKKKKNGRKAPTIFIIKKTGYLNLWINGTHYYYNYQNQYDPHQNFDFPSIVRNSGQRTNTRRRTITITRKR